MAEHTQSLWIDLVVTDIYGKGRNRMTLDFLRSDSRTRIAKTAWWAMHNGHQMTTVPTDRAEPLSEAGSKPRRVGQEVAR